VGYRTAQAALDAALPKTFEARIRAHVLLKQHGQEICKRARPMCERCPVSRDCAYFSAHGSRPHRVENTMG
jgi:endonuclease-3